MCGGSRDPEKAKRNKGNKEKKKTKRNKRNKEIKKTKKPRKTPAHNASVVQSCFPSKTEKPERPMYCLRRLLKG